MAKVEILIDTEQVHDTQFDGDYRTTMRLVVSYDDAPGILAQNRTFYSGMPFSKPEASEEFAIRSLGRALGRLIDFCAEGL